MYFVAPKPVEGEYEPVLWLIPHGSDAMEPAWVFGLTFRFPLRMSFIRKAVTSVAVSGMLKSSTGNEYLFHTVAWTMRPVFETLVIAMRVSVCPRTSGMLVPTLVTPLRETRKYGTSRVAAGTLSDAQVTAMPVPATARSASATRAETFFIFPPTDSYWDMDLETEPGSWT